MRQEEAFVRDALLAFLNEPMKIRAFDGEDPPDFYLERYGEARVAVEVTRLAQMTYGPDGTVGNRESDDNFGLGFIEELNHTLASEIPDTVSLVVCLHLPTQNGRSFKKAVRRWIGEIVRDPVPRPKIERVINGATVSVTVVAEDNASKKVRGIIANRHSSSDILLNARLILEERIRTKDSICSRLASVSPVWLAMLNDYWLADADTYVMAKRKLDIQHCFERLFIVSGGGHVTEL